MRPFVAHVRLELALTLRNGESLLLTMGIPIGLLVFFSVVDVLPIEGEPVDFLAPGLLALAVLSTSFANLAIATGFDRSYGVLKRLGATPLGRPRLVAAKVVTGLAVLVIQAVLVVGAGVALGWRPDLAIAPVVGAVVLATVAFTGLALAIAGRLPAMMTLALANALFVALLLLSGMVFPLEELPAGLRAGAEVLPSTALAEVMHGSLTEGVGVPGRAWSVLMGWAVGAVVAAVYLFRWEPGS